MIQYSPAFNNSQRYSAPFLDVQPRMAPKESRNRLFFDTIKEKVFAEVKMKRFLKGENHGSISK